MKGRFLLVCAVGVGLLAAGVATAKLSLEERLGKELFFANIADPPSMSCANCHAPQVGWTGPVAGINQHGAVYHGAVATRFGNRKPPASGYATLSPVFHLDGVEGIFVGGNFWDGRATGEVLGNPAADQAGGPFLNPVEQNMPSKQAVCERVYELDLKGLFERVWGAGSLDCSADGAHATYDLIARSIAAYEASTEVNAFSSKFDAYLAGKATLTEQEAWGMALFNGEAMCSNCHISEAEGGMPPLFTDFTFDNLGVPRNPENPFYDMDEVYLDDGSPINPDGRDWLDPGLGGFLATRPDYAAMAYENIGKHKVPTLRNVGLGTGEGFPKAYGHNGYFKSLKAITHFYNTRDVMPVCPDPFTTEKDAMAAGCWPAAEITINVNHDELGNLGLTDGEEDALVAFMNTLSDGYFNPRK